LGTKAVRRQKRSPSSAAKRLTFYVAKVTGALTDRWLVMNPNDHPNDFQSPAKRTEITVAMAEISMPLSRVHD